MCRVVVCAGCFFAQATDSLLLKDSQDGVSSRIDVQAKKGNTMEGKLLSHLGRNRGRVEGKSAKRTMRSILFFESAVSDV